MVDGVEQPKSRVYTLQSNSFAKWARPVVEAVALLEFKYCRVRAPAERAGSQLVTGKPARSRPR